MCKWLTNGVTNHLLRVINSVDPPSMKPFLQGGCCWRGEKCQHPRPTKTVHCYVYDSIEILTRNHPHHQKWWLLANLHVKYLSGSVSHGKKNEKGGGFSNQRREFYIQHLDEVDRLVTWTEKIPDPRWYSASAGFPCLVNLLQVAHLDSKFHVGFRARGPVAGTHQTQSSTTFHEQTTLAVDDASNGIPHRGNFSFVCKVGCSNWRASANLDNTSCSLHCKTWYCCFVFPFFCLFVDRQPPHYISEGFSGPFSPMLLENPFWGPFLGWWKFLSGWWSVST